MRDGADLPPGVMPFPHAERVSLPDPASVPVLDAIRAALPDPARAAREALLASTALAAGTVPGDTPVGTPRDATPGTRDRRPAMGG